MKSKKIAYSAIALSKRKAIKRDVKAKHGQAIADRVSDHISKALSELKKYPEIGTSMREQYDLDCDYYMFFVEHNYFIYRIMDDMIMILEIFNEKEDFMYQLFGIVTHSIIWNLFIYGKKCYVTLYQCNDQTYQILISTDTYSHTTIL